MADDTGGSGPECTEDGRYIVVNGRRWRASDPGIPEKLRAELVAVLMKGRREVRTRGDEVRPVVHDAKVALGERGEAWWEPTEDGRRDRLAAVIRTLLRHRDESTICPSDAARVVGGDGWKPLMPLARTVAADLTAGDVVRIQQKGADVDLTEGGIESLRGPIRIAPGAGLTH